MSAFYPLRPTRYSRFLRALRLLNLVIDFDGYAPVVGEVQIHYRPILELKVRRRKLSLRESVTMRVVRRRRSTTSITKSFAPPMLMS